MCARRRSNRNSPSEGYENINVPLQINGQSFTFRLCTRQLNFWLENPIQYYWFRHESLLETSRNLELSQCRSIIEFWRQAMIEAGALSNPEQSDTYLLASCYPVLCRKKGIQNVFIDAVSGHHADREYKATGSPELIDETRAHIRDVVTQRDVTVLRNEFADIFGWPDLTNEARHDLNLCLDNWLGVGLRMMSENVESGVEDFVQKIQYWDGLLVGNSRTPDVIRIFLDHFAYSCKCAFYRCYAQVWSKLINSLLEHHGLDAVSARFLCLWHNQNRPIENRDSQGRTIYEPDVFFGHILALHPLSGHFMAAPEPDFVSALVRVVDPISRLALPSEGWINLHCN